MSINDDIDIIMEEAEKTQSVLKEDEEIKSLAHSFIVGQGSVYVLEKQNKIMSNGTAVFNGPVYKERSWNTRILNKSAVQELVNTNGGLLFPKSQEFAVIIAASKSLLDGIELEPYESHIFPDITFKDSADGEIHVVNGHHRMEALISKNKSLLTLQNKYLRTLELFKIPSDNDTQEIIIAREKLAELQEALCKKGGWGAIVLNYGMFNAILINIINNAYSDEILKSPRAADIKAYWARNTQHFHVPDSEADLLQFILRSVTSMTEQEGYKFLEMQLKRTSLNSQIKLRATLKNPQLLHLFSNLTRFPMFGSTTLLNYSQLYSWRKIVPCWLEWFLNFAQDSYCYMSAPCNATLQSIKDVKNHMDLVFIYQLFDTTFHDIIDAAYKEYLVPNFMAFGVTGGKIEINGEVVADWNSAFAKYRKNILKDIKIWAEGNTQPQQYHAILKVFVERTEYILDYAHKVYPHISTLESPIPLASTTFIKDVASDLYSVQDGMIEVCCIIH